MNIKSFAFVGAAVIALGIAGATTTNARTVEDQCADATIRTALCDGNGGVVSGGSVSGESHGYVAPSRVWQEDRTFVYFDGFDEETGEPMWSEIVVKDVVPGSFDNDGFYVRDYEGNYEDN